jgi:uncharacterized protein (DUF1778 family)
MAGTTERTRRTGRFNFRITTREEALIKAAAQVRGLSASQYVAESVAKQAGMDLADRRHFTLSDDRMAAFEEALDRPVREKPRLRRLMAERTVLEPE